MISGRTRVFAILGNPVAHSASPAMHNAAFRALGLDAVYVPLACEAAEVPALMRRLAANGGGGNVTVPHKGAAAAAVERGTPRVRTLEACNTFWGEEGALAGDNTDVDGVAAALADLGVAEGPWLVVGTGGSARAVVAAAAAHGAGVAIRSRDPARAAAFQAWAAEAGAAPAEPGACVAVVNATPLGLHATDALPLDPGAVPAGAVALDLVYAKGGTPWVRALRARGVRAADGRAMLVAQGAAAFERWYPGVRAPVEVMRAALRGVLG